MSDFEQLIENYLHVLRAGEVLEIPTGQGRFVLFNAAIGAELQLPSLEKIRRFLLSKPIFLLVTDERQLVQMVSAYDLSDTDRLEAGEEMYMQGILGIADDWLGSGQSAKLLWVKDITIFTIIKRLRLPLAGIRLELYPDH